MSADNKSDLLCLLLCAVTGTTACTNAELYLPPQETKHIEDNKISIAGEFCAEGSDDLQGFLKITLIIDRSNSLNVTDPNNQRISAARDLVLRFVQDPVTLELQTGVEIALISFFGDTVVHTRDARGLPGFSTDTAQILFSISQIAQTGSNTGYDTALAQAFLILDRDMAQMSDKARGLSRYQTVFLSDGMPFPDNCRGEANSPTAAIAAVERIQALQALHRVPHTLSTAFASDPRMFTAGNDVDNCQDSDPFEAQFNNSLGDETRALLQGMAAAGDGTFTQFANGDAINFTGFEFADARRIFALSNFIATNLNARPDFDRVQPDSDADGVLDVDERRMGTSPYLRDTDDDGFNDGLEWRFRSSGLDPLDPHDAVCDDNVRIDTDGDSLLDCEESFYGSLRRSVDSDADGFPDNIEVLFNTNVKSATPFQDLQADADADGGTNSEELRWHTDPNVDDVAFRSKLAYLYQQSEKPLTTGQACYDFEVSNVALASTRSAPEFQHTGTEIETAGLNRVMLYMAQHPYDDPIAEPLYRMACVDARYIESRDLKVPAGGHVELPAERPSDTYRMGEVLRPNRNQCIASVNIDCGVNTIWCRFDDAGGCSCNRPPDIVSSGGDINGEPYGDGSCPACSNGIDDDGDGLTDFPFDPDCFDSLDDGEGSDHACTNGIDDDGDGLADWPNDPGCDSGFDNDETSPDPLPACADGIDNDNDGAADFPNDPGCYAAVDDTEGDALGNPVPACGDGLDNDGDGLIDMEDAGCFDPDDIDEDGPAACFYCEQFTDNRPGQCDIRAGYCRPRAGIPAAGGCTNSAECRGGICDIDTGRCSPCLADDQCDEGLVCDARNGWCLAPVMAPVECAADGDCPGTCDTDLGICEADPYFSCRGDRDCAPGQLCSEERGFCLQVAFETAQCSAEAPCANGLCDDEQGFCLPQQESERCRDDDECPRGRCRSDGYCDQQTFVFPEEFDASRDCLRAR